MIAILAKSITEPFGPPPTGADVLWRCDGRVYSVTIDPEREIYGTSDPVLELTWHPVAKRTPCGARLECGRFVNLQAREQWASETREDAVESFRQRRRRQIKILRAQLKRAELEFYLADKY